MAEQDTSSAADGVRTEGLHEETLRLETLEYLGGLRPGGDEAMLQKLVEDVRSIFGADACMLNLVLSDTTFPRVWSGEPPPPMHKEFPSEWSPCLGVVETESQSSVGDLEGAVLREGHGFHSYAGAPLVTSGGVAVGALCVLFRRPREFTGEDSTLLAAFASAGASASSFSGPSRGSRRRGEKNPGGTSNTGGFSTPPPTSYSRWTSRGFS